MAKAKTMIVVHTHERSEGSTIVAVFPATKKGKAAAEKLRASLDTGGVDMASANEAEVKS